MAGQSQLYSEIGRLLNDVDHDNQTKDIRSLYTPVINPQTGTSYTIASTDQNCVVTLNNSAAITVTVPNSLPAGFTCVVIQLGAGQVTFVAASGGGLSNAHSSFKLFGQYAVSSLFTVTNSSGTNALTILAGDTA